MKKVFIAFLCAMFLVSAAGVFGFPYAGLSVFLGIAAFFISKPKGSYEGSGFDLLRVPANLREKGVWLWILLPLALNALSLAVASAVLPSFSAHLLARTAPLLSFERLPMLFLQLVVLALGEELAWRAFFQNQLSKYLPALPAIALASLAFTLGHFSSAPPLLVTYDLFWIAANSCVYGYLFYKTNNAWVSALSHFLANSFAVFLLFMAM